MIDNFDSFVYNLKAYFQELGREILVKRCDEITLKELEAMNPEGIILSPGPKRPWDAKLCVDTVKKFQGRIPILGVCLGHQVIGHCAGAVVEKGVRPMHGKVTEIHNHGTGVFAGLPEKYKVTRYHSLIVREDSIPEEYQVDAVSDDGAVMEFPIKHCLCMAYSSIRKLFLRNMAMSFLRISVRSQRNFIRRGKKNWQKRKLLRSKNNPEMNAARLHS